MGEGLKRARKAAKATRVRPKVRVLGHWEFTTDIACGRCGADDPITDRQRRVGTGDQWLCDDCSEAHK